jgi:5-methylcytosine-specific restriction endonuclease McrA
VARASSETSRLVPDLVAQPANDNGRFDQASYDRERRQDPVRRAYMRAYRRAWVARRRAAFFADKGCTLCGSTEGLEIDHVDPTAKVNHKIWSWSAARREAELAKCRVLCRRCHIDRHAEELRKPLTHGTVNGYVRKGCRCTACRA